MSVIYSLGKKTKSAKFIRSSGPLSQNKYITDLLRPINSLFAVVGLVVLVAVVLNSSYAVKTHKLNLSSTGAIVNPTINVVSPSPGAISPDILKLSADLGAVPVTDYDMFWYVDNGAWNWMANSPAEASSKSADVSTANWNWHKPSNVYTIYFVAVIHDTGQRIYTSVPIQVNQAGQTGLSQPPTVSGATASDNRPTALTAPDIKLLVKPTDDSPAENAVNPVINLITKNTPTNLYVNPDSNAGRLATTTNDPTTKRIMSKLATTAAATWYGDWNTSVRSDVNTVVSAAAAAQQVPVLVTYNIPGRDCGNYSAGGSASTTAYQAWIKEFAAGIGSRKTIVILEPDALAQLDCLSGADQTARYQLLSFAVATLKSTTAAAIYLDAGNANWKSPEDMATRLKLANVAASDGFSLNISNFITTSSSTAYGHKLSALTANKHFVIDTSRNGNGASDEWCNPKGRALGVLPTSQTGDSLIDYLLWVKTPGESDGMCNGGPVAGAWWPVYAETLAKNAAW